MLVGVASVLGYLQFKGSFQVPLNYLEPISSSNRASIALIRTLSPYPPTSQNYKGPLIFNPGGPGGSGVDTMVNDGSLLREYLGDAFDILSFDPRGMCRFRASRLSRLLIFLSSRRLSFYPIRLVFRQQRRQRNMGCQVKCLQYR